MSRSILSLLSLICLVHYPRPGFAEPPVPAYGNAVDLGAGLQGLQAILSSHLKLAKAYANAAASSAVPQPALQYGSPSVDPNVGTSHGAQLLPLQPYSKPLQAKKMPKGVEQTYFLSPKDKILYQITAVSLANAAPLPQPGNYGSETRQLRHGGLSALYVPVALVPSPAPAYGAGTGAPSAGTSGPGSEETGNRDKRPRLRSRPKYNFTFAIQTYNSNDDCADDDESDSYGEGLNPNLTPQKVGGYRKKRQACGDDTDGIRSQNPLRPLKLRNGSQNARNVAPSYGPPAASSYQTGYGSHAGATNAFGALASTPPGSYGAFSSLLSSNYGGLSSTPSSALYAVPSPSTSYGPPAPAAPTSYGSYEHGAPSTPAGAGYYDEIEVAGPASAVPRGRRGGRRGYGITGQAAGEI